VKKLFVSGVAAALATLSLVAVVPGAVAGVDDPVAVSVQCWGGPPNGGAAKSDIIGTRVTAPTSVEPDGTFDVSVAFDPKTLPSSTTEPLAVTIVSYHHFVLKFAVPSGATVTAASRSGGSGLGAGTPTVTHTGSTVTLSVPGPINPTAGPITFPTVTMTLQATGVPGATVEPKLAGSSFTDPGYTLQTDVRLGIIPINNQQTTCYPVAAGTALDTTGGVKDRSTLTFPPAYSPPLSSTTIGTAPAFTAAAPPSGRLGQPYTYDFGASGSPSPTFSLASGALPDGLALSPAGVLSGTPTATGSYTFALKAANGLAPDAVTGDVTVDIDDAPAFTAASPPGTASQGSPYAYQFEASGYPDPVFSVASGALPDGLTLSPSGSLSGTPTVLGSSTFSVKAANGIAPDAVTGDLTVEVIPPANPTLVDASPPLTGSAGVPYGPYTFTATGSPTPTFAVGSGSLPPGLSLSAAGVLSGTPDAGGASTFTVKATNGVEPDAETGPITITVDEAPAFSAYTPATAATVGFAYPPYTFTATGHPAPTITLTGGSLPPGLILAGGVLSGTPTDPGVHTFTVGAANGVAPAASVEVTISVAAAVAPAFTSAAPPSTAAVGTPYLHTFSASGNPAPSFAVAPAGGTPVLPSGFAIDAVSGELTWTPSTPGPVTFTVSAANGVGGAVVAGPFTVEVHEKPTFDAADPPTSVGLGDSYGPYAFRAHGTPDPTFTVEGTLPAGLTLDEITGVLSGTPLAGGAHTFSVRAGNDAGSVLAGPFTVTVTAAPEWVASSPPGAATAGRPYGPYTFAASGFPAPAFSVVAGSLPPGLALTSGGVLSGTTTALGDHSFEVEASNGIGDPVSVVVSIRVSVPATPPPRWPGWDIARTVVANPSGPGGWTLDGWGGVHAWGGAPETGTSPLWRGWAIARDVALDASGRGYVLDGWGGLHPVGGAPQVRVGPYWSGWDIARAVVVNPAGPGGWILDGWGAVQPFGGARALRYTAYWRGWDIARDLVVTSDGEGGYVLDGWGGIHPVGAAPPVSRSAYWKGSDLARAIALEPAGGGGWVLDGWGGLHPFGGAPALRGGGHWPGWDIARSLSVGPDGTGFVVDGWGGVHPVRAAH